MVNIIVEEWGDKYSFQDKKEMVEEILGRDYYRLSEEEQYERLKLRTLRNAAFANKPTVDLKNGDRVQDIKIAQYIICDEETFLLSLAKNKDIVIYEKEDADIFAKGIDKTNLEKIFKEYIRINDCVDEILQKKLQSLNLNLDNVKKNDGEER